jgi:hypothetical protein
MYFLVDLYFDHSHFFGPENSEKDKYKKYFFLDPFMFINVQHYLFVSTVCHMCYICLVMEV